MGKEQLTRGRVGAGGDSPGQPLAPQRAAGSGVGQGRGTEGRAASAVGWCWGPASAQTATACQWLHSSVSSPGFGGHMGSPGRWPREPRLKGQELRRP